ncbi:MAG: twin-arginine translocation signal domain-containing protein [Chitinophagaceae bacterium]
MTDNRRDFIKLAGLAGVSLAGRTIIPGNAGQVELPVKSSPDNIPALAPLNRFPRMVQEYFVGRVREIDQVSEKRRAGLRTKSDAEAYVRDVRSKIQKCFGPWPEKTPLNSRVTGVLDRDIYKVEKVIFESRPGFLVTGNLYVPKIKSCPCLQL